MTLLAVAVVLAAAGSLEVWEDEVRGVNATGEFYLSTKGGMAREVVRGMKGKLQVAKHGMLRVDGMVPKTACDTMLGEVDVLRPKAKRGSHHHNVAIELTEAARGVYLPVIDNAYKLLKDLVTESGVLVAMGIMVNDPGARNQKWHADTIPTPRAAKLYTFWIALEDVTEDMGPTGLIAGSHRDEFLQACEAEITKTRRAPCQALIDSSPKLAATLSQGDMLIMDSTLHHRANSNKSGKRRRYLYFCMTAPGPRPTGSTYTLKEGYKSARLTLRNYRDWHKAKP